MSINLNIQVPLETVASMLEVADVDSDRQALAISTAQASKAVLDAVKALPDHVKSELAAKHVKVMVSTFTKRKILITINADAYPADLAYALHINEKVPLDNVSLLFGGLWIFSINGDSVRRTLKELGIADGAVVFLLTGARPLALVRGNNSDKVITLHIQHLGPDTTAFTVKGNARASEVATMVQHEKGIRVIDQIMIYNGMKFFDGEYFNPRLDQVGISDGATVFLRTKLPGPRYGFMPGTESEDIRVTVKTLTGNTHSLELKRNAYMFQLAGMLYEIEGIPPAQERLIFAGKTLPLDDGEDEVANIKLYQAGVTDGSEIMLAFKLRGS